MNEQEISKMTKKDLEQLVIGLQETIEEDRKIIEFRTRELEIARKAVARYQHEARRAREQLVGARARFKRKLKRVNIE